MWQYVAHDSPAAADRQLDSIDERCRLYAEQPLLGEERPEFEASLRSFSVGNYVVIYRPSTDGIDVLSVIHGARDIPAHLRDIFLH